MPTGTQSGPVSAVRVIFVSSPRDLTQEEEAIDEAVSEVNRSVGIRLGVHYRTWRWKRDARSQQGTSGQAVIEQQLPEYALYVGMVGEFYGTPDSQGESGTERELRDATARKRAGRCSQVSFFTRQRPIADPDLNQLDEMRKVLEFIQRIQTSHGVLTEKFPSCADLMYLVRLLLIEDAFNNSPGLSTQVIQTSEARRQISEATQAFIVATADLAGTIELSKTTLTGLGNTIADTGALAIEWHQRHPKDADTIASIVDRLRSSRIDQLNVVSAFFRKLVAFAQALVQMAETSISYSNETELEATLTSLRSARATFSTSIQEILTSVDLMSLPSEEAALLPATAHRIEAFRATMHEEGGVTPQALSLIERAEGVLELFLARIRNGPPAPSAPTTREKSAPAVG